MKTSLFTPVAAARTACSPSYPSTDALAKALSAAYPGERWPANRSLAVKIGAIDKGDLVWWKKRPANAAALAALLQVPLADLGLHEESGTRLFSFKNFPELPPIDLAHETPCDIGHIVGSNTKSHEIIDLPWWEGALATGMQRAPMAGISWVEFAPGTGLSLFWDSLCARTPRRHVHRPKLSDASADLRQRGALLLRCDQPCDQADLLALANADPDLAILIVAPFAAPLDQNAVQGDWDAWEFVSGDANARLAALTNPHSLFTSMQRYTWRLHDNWQARLLDWVETRLTRATHDTLFSAEGVAAWLADFSPWENFCPLPADVLALCRLCHSTHKSSLPKATEPHAGRILLTRALRVSPSVARSFSQRLGGRLLDLALPWQGALPEAQWEQLVPDAGNTLDDDDLFAIAKGKSAAHRLQIAQAATKRNHAGLQVLIDAGLLVSDPFGNLRCQPPFLVDMLARDHLIGMIVDGPVENWALCCYDQQRRSLVDEAMHAITADALIPVLDRIQAMAPDSLAAIAASDALFWNIGLRLCDGDANVPQVFGTLADVVVARMWHDDDFTAVLWSRGRDVEETSVTWLAVCWSWSLWYAHATFVGAGLDDWYFPAWTPELATRLSFVHFNQVKLPGEDGPLTAGWRRLLAMAGQVTQVLPIPPEDGPDFLKPALLLEGVKGRWPIKETWLKPFLGNPHITSWLDRALTSLPEPIAAARMLLPVLMNIANHIGGDQISTMYFYRSPIRTWVLRTLPAETALACLDDVQRAALWRRPLALPPTLLTALLDSIDAAQAEDGTFWLGKTIGHCGPAQTAALVRLIRRGLLVTDAAERLWQLAPSEAQSLLRDTALGDEAATALVYATPSAWKHAAAEAILANPALLDDGSRRWWALSNLPHSNGHAAKFAAILSLPATAAPDNAG